MYVARVRPALDNGDVKKEVLEKLYGLLLFLLACGVWILKSVTAQDLATAHPLSWPGQVLAVALLVHVPAFACFEYTRGIRRTKNPRERFLYFLQLPMVLFSIIASAVWFLIALILAPLLFWAWAFVATLGVIAVKGFCALTDSIRTTNTSELVELSLKESAGYGLASCAVFFGLASVTFYHFPGDQPISRSAAWAWRSLFLVSVTITSGICGYLYGVGKAVCPKIKISDIWARARAERRMWLWIGLVSVHLAAMIFVTAGLRRWLTSDWRLFTFIYLWWLLPFLIVQFLTKREVWNWPWVLMTSATAVTLTVLAHLLPGRFALWGVALILPSTVAALTWVRFKRTPSVNT